MTALALAVAALLSLADTPSVTLFIPSLSCPSCQRNIRNALAGETRIATVEIDAGRGLARLFLADRRAPTDSFVETITRAGYVATPMTEERMFRWRGSERALERAQRALLRTPGVRGYLRHGEFVKVSVERGRLDDDDLRAVARRAASSLRLTPVAPAVPSPAPPPVQAPSP